LNSTLARDAVAILIRALDSKDNSVRLAALCALGRFGDDAIGAIKRLRALEQDPVPQVANAATAARRAIEVRSVSDGHGSSDNP
jgi:HEAT repeat protein